MNLKKISYLILCLASASGVYGQKPVITREAVKTWEQTNSARISNNGKFAYYEVVSGDSSRFYVKNLSTGKEINIICKNVIFTTDSRSLVYETGNDKIVFLDLTTFKIRNTYLGSNLNSIGRYLYWHSPASKKPIVHVWPAGGSKLLDFKDALEVYPLPSHGTSKILMVSKCAQNFYTVSMADLNTMESQLLWKRAHKYPTNVVSDHSGSKIAFFCRDSIAESNSQIFILNLKSQGNRTDSVALGESKGFGDHLVFNKNGDFLAIRCFDINKDQASEMLIKKQVYIWHYKDKFLQSEQLNEGHDSVLRSQTKWIIYDLPKSRICPISSSGLSGVSIDLFTQSSSSVFLLTEVRTPTDLQLIPSEELKKSISYCDLVTNRQVEIASSGYYTGLSVSPGEKYILYYDFLRKKHLCYVLSTGKTVDFSIGVTQPLYNVQKYEELHPLVLPESYGIWLKGDSTIMLNDEFDIWAVDPLGLRSPVCITGGIGRQQKIKLDIFQPEGETKNSDLRLGGWIWLKGVRKTDYQEGFTKFRLLLASTNHPKLKLDTVNFQRVINKNSFFLVKKSNAAKTANWFLTKDFLRYKTISNIHSENMWKWYSKKLISVSQDNKEITKAIVYKPQDFDNKKKYPVIFNFYEILSDKIYTCPPPRLANGPIDPAWMCSRDYIVCQLDIHYKFGEPGPSAVKAVTAVASYLAKYPWVDSTRMAISGESHGAYAVNYIATQTNRFAAALSAYGMVDLVSGYDQLRGSGESRQWIYETSQGRMGTSLWENREGYINNSPIFFAKNIQMPVLILQNKDDGQVPWTQGMEWYLALRRLGKASWMLQYVGEGHGLHKESNRLDYTLKIEQYFDHYLKGKEAPVWLSNGLPARKIEQGMNILSNPSFNR